MQPPRSPPNPATPTCRGCRRLLPRRRVPPTAAVLKTTLLAALAFTPTAAAAAASSFHHQQQRRTISWHATGSRAALAPQGRGCCSFVRPTTSTTIPRSRQRQQQQGGRHGDALLPSSSSPARLLPSSPSPWRHRGDDDSRSSSLVVCSAVGGGGGVDLGLAIYDLQIWAKEVVDNQLTHLTPVSGAILYGAGLLTSLSPCALSLVPLTMAYLTDDSTPATTDMTQSESERAASAARLTLFFRASMFTIGLALSLSLLGLSATLAGRLFGTVGGAGILGSLLPLSASLVAVAMGLNLLELIRLELPSFESSLPLDKLPPPAQAFLLGASSALIASPCSTPVLASILGFVATSGQPYLGVGLLFAYSLGYSTPLLLAGLVSGTVTSFIRSKGDQFSWVTPATAAVLISYGTYSGLNTLFPPQL